MNLLKSSIKWLRNKKPWSWLFIIYLLLISSLSFWEMNRRKTIKQREEEIQKQINEFELGNLDYMSVDLAQEMVKRGEFNDIKNQQKNLTFLLMD